MFNYRLGFDFGYASLGWACIELDDNNQPCKVHDFGVRIFPSGRNDLSKEPTSVERRMYRGARRNRDRYLQRRQHLLEQMIKLGLQPKEAEKRTQLAQLEPLFLRNKAVQHELTPYEIGRVLFHLNQRRGFQSNRIADRANAEEQTGLKKGIQTLERYLTEHKLTLGQYLYQRLQNNQPIRIKVDENESAEDRWTSRKMYLDEFDKIMKVQQQYHPSLLTSDVINQLKSTIFFQRPLRIPEAGTCTLLEGEKRAAQAYPETQRFRIFQEVNNLEIMPEDEHTPRITLDMRQRLYSVLCDTFQGVNEKGMLSWSAIQKCIGIKKVHFNLQKQERAGLKADTTTQKMTLIDHLWWRARDAAQQRAIIDMILTAQSEKKMHELCQSHPEWAINHDIFNALNNISLDSGYGRLSLKAIESIMPFLKEGLTYDKACLKAGLNHSELYDGIVYQQGNLPYYGEVLRNYVIGGNPNTDAQQAEAHYGKINNPTVHMALNQFRRIINELVHRYGNPPAEIYIEMARDTPASARQLKLIEKEQTQNRKKNEEINAILEKLSITQSYDNRMKYKLWEDLDSDPSGRCCPLSGRSISMEQLFSSEIEIEHIIPFSRSFDDSRNNKMLCFRDVNRLKKNKTPFEAFGDTSEWNDILARAKKMSSQNNSKSTIDKFWRFLPNAMEKLGEDENAWLARQLNDNKYMSRVARRYAEYVTGREDGKSKVFTIKGKYTADLRHHWGLDQLVSDPQTGSLSKNRNTHHHHAIDAIVIALSSPATIQQLANANKRAKELDSRKMYLKVGLPFAHFNIEEIKQRLDSMVISHKPDHKNPQQAKKLGKGIGQLHEETNYGHIKDDVYATRKPFEAEYFTSLDNILEIADTRIRKTLHALLKPLTDNKGKLLPAHKLNYIRDFKIYKHQSGIKRVRIHQHKTRLIPFYNQHHQAYRYAVGGNNFCAEIWCSPKGKKANQWQCEVISNFDINQHGFTPQWRRENPFACKIMRLQINDMVAIEHNNQRTICRVQKIIQSGEIILRHHNDSQTDHKTHISTAASSLQKRNARKLYVSPAGLVYDPGHAKIPNWQKK